MANAPLVGQDGGSRKVFLPDGGSGIFLREGLDRVLVICSSCQFVAGLVGCVVRQIRLRHALTMFSTAKGERSGRQPGLRAIGEPRRHADDGASAGDARSTPRLSKQTVMYIT